MAALVWRVLASFNENESTDGMEEVHECEKKIPIGINTGTTVCKNIYGFLQRSSNPALAAVHHRVNALFGPRDLSHTIHAGDTQQNELKRDR